MLSTGLNVLSVGYSEMKTFPFGTQLMVPVNTEEMGRVPTLICDKEISNRVAQQGQPGSCMLKCLLFPSLL